MSRYSFEGWTPLHFAAHFGQLDAMRILMSNGASHRAISKNSNANQPFQAAAAGRQTEALKLLLKAGAEADARSHGGFTALQIAAANDRCEFQRLMRKERERALLQEPQNKGHRPATRED